MSYYQPNPAENAAVDFKCTACGHTWTTSDPKLDTCPACGYTCTGYSCQVLPASAVPTGGEKTPEDGFVCTACGYVWTRNDIKQDKCPSCGYACNPYSCQVVIPPKSE